MQEVENLLLSLFGHCADACAVAAVGLDENAYVLLVTVAQPCYAVGCPGVELAVDVYHLRVVLCEVVNNLAVCAAVELYIVPLLAEHDLLVVVFQGLFDVLFEGLDVIAVVTEVLYSLNRE